MGGVGKDGVGCWGGVGVSYLPISIQVHVWKVGGRKGGTVITLDPNSQADRRKVIIYAYRFVAVHGDHLMG